MKKYYFVIAQGSSTVSGHAYTLIGIRHIFKKIDNSDKCCIFRKCGITYETIPFITYKR